MLVVAKAVHMGGEEGIWEISVPPAQFHCAPKTALRSSSKKIATQQANISIKMIKQFLNFLR